jgi:hypothetical protein
LYFVVHFVSSAFPGSLTGREIKNPPRIGRVLESVLVNPQLVLKFRRPAMARLAQIGVTAVAFGATAVVIMAEFRNIARKCRSKVDGSQ